MTVEYSVFIVRGEASGFMGGVKSEEGRCSPY